MIVSVDIVVPDVCYEIPKYGLSSKENRKILDRAGGVYFIYDKAGALLYVGQSTNLLNRLWDHVKGRDRSRLFCDDIEHFEVYVIEDGYCRELFETYSIHKRKPSYNSDKVFSPGYRTDEAYYASERAAELVDEREALKSEIASARYSLGNALYYEEDDAGYEGLRSWGDILLAERRVSELNAEIRELRKET